MYRPQFAFSTPEGCRDEEFTYFFDANNTPMLGTDLYTSAGLKLDNIPLVFEQDAPFYWRGIKVGMTRAAAEQPTTYVFPDLWMMFQDCYLNPLSDGLVPATQYGFPMNPLQFQNSLLTGPPVPLDPEIYCPKGGYLLLFLRTPPSLTGTALLNVTLYGVKRFKQC